MGKQVALFTYFSIRDRMARHRAVGWVRYRRADLVKMRDRGEFVDVWALGVLQFARDVPPLLAEEVILRLRVRGVMIATPGVRARLRSKRR